MTDKYEKAAEEAIETLKMRRGFDHFWGPIDRDIQEGIRQDVADAIRFELEPQAEGSGGED